MKTSGSNNNDDNTNAKLKRRSKKKNNMKKGKTIVLLEIFLGINAENPRLDSSVWEFLTLRDVYKLRTLSKSIRASLEFVEYSRCRDGSDYLVPFPGFPGVLSTPTDVKNGAGLFTHQLASLRAMHKAENSNTEFGALRGGILGDAPGLGKTITMLSLIASTAGCKPMEPKEFYDRESIDEHWKLMRTNPVFRTEILKSLKPIRESCYDIREFNNLAEYVEPPYEDDRFPTITSFEAFVRSKMRNKVSETRLDLFRRNVIAFKAGLDKRNRRYFNNPKGRRMMLERNLIPASTNLIIVPNALLEHWAEQIRRHINIDVFADNDGGSEGVVYIDGVGDLSTARFPLNHNGSMAMISPFELCRYLMVLVPFSRIKEQYYLRKRRREETRTVSSDPTHQSQSALLQLRWFRIIVDEGHELGEHEAASDITQFINDLASERRWAMSGTPTTGDEDSPEFTARGLNQFQRLLLFLRHDKYGIVPDDTNAPSGRNSKAKKDQAKSAWNVAVKAPFLSKNDTGREELYRVLDEVMVMHKKEDIMLPKPIFKQAEVTIPIPTDVQTKMVETVHSAGSEHEYLKALSEMGVSATRLVSSKLRMELDSALERGGSAPFDLLLSEFLHTDNFQTLVDKGQADHIVERIESEKRQLEERGGAIVSSNGPITAATTSSAGISDRRPIKCVVYSQSHNNLLSVAEHLYRSFEPENIAELTEGRIADMAYELGRFRNNYKEGKKCPICLGWNDFSGKKLIGCKRLLMEVCDAYGNTYLIESDRVLRAVGQTEFDASNEKVGVPVNITRLDGAPLSEYTMSHKNWQVGDALCIDAREDHPLMRKRWSHEQWEAYGSARCMELAAADLFEGRDNFLGPLPQYEDGGSAVFVQLRKWQQCGKFHGRGKKRWYTGPTLENVDLEQEAQNVFVLLLDANLSHGLDLSFVTHLFLLEPIDDAALLEQVSSRAFRLGCTGPVTIETVNVWQELEQETKQLAKKVSSTIQDEDKKRTSTAVCEHCYRSFDSIKKAEAHERTCDRNPESSAEIDRWHLSSVYRDIKPPPPVIVGLPESGENKDGK